MHLALDYFGAGASKSAGAGGVEGGAPWAGDAGVSRSAGEGAVAE